MTEDHQIDRMRKYVEKTAIYRQVCRKERWRGVLPVNARVDGCNSIPRGRRVEARIERRMEFPSRWLSVATGEFATMIHANDSNSNRRISANSFA